MKMEKDTVILYLQNQSKSQQDKHESYKLNWAGKEYAKAYKKTMEQAQRDTFVLKTKKIERNMKTMN